MSSLVPPRLLDLAGRSLVRAEAVAIAAVDLLPVELFPPLLKAAVDGRHRGVLRALVQAWPLPLLPLGALVREQQCHQATLLMAALSGLEALLAEKLRPRRCKLQVLDLRADCHQDFWATWAGVSVTRPLLELEAELPVVKRQRVEGPGPGARWFRAPVEVLMNVRLDIAVPDQFLTALLEKVRWGRGLLRLCCKKVQVVSMPVPIVERVLKTVQLHSIQNLEMNCTWPLVTLSRFAPFLGQMVNLRRFLLCHLQVLPSRPLRAREEPYVYRFASQFIGLQRLRELRFDCISFLEGRLQQVLRCLNSPLETLSITNCVLVESDLVHLSLCPNTGQLKDLSLSGVNLTSLRTGPLRVLLERVSATLQDLDLDECGIVDAQFRSILPSLSRCSQLRTFSFCGNFVSGDALESLLWHTAGLPHMDHTLYPAPLETYEHGTGLLHLERLALLHARLMRILREVGRPGRIWFSATLCPQCGDRTFYDPNPIQCPCYMPAQPEA